MLEYAKTILPKVSFSRELFQKELHKCINWVEQSQLKELYMWCYEKFNKLYPNILAKEFSGIIS